MAVSHGSLEGRNGEIWQHYCAGWTQEALGERYGITQTRVSAIIRATREKIGKHDRDEFVDRQVDAMQALQRKVHEMIEADPPPAYNQRGNILLDENGQVVRDVAAKQRAIDLQLKTLAQMAKLLGLDATKTIDVNVTAAEKGAAESLAADAASFLHGLED